MTPKEKAEELVGKFYDHGIEDMTSKKQAKQDAEQCALIAVDEIIKALEVVPHKELREVCLNYWQEVKNEIDKL